MHSSLPPIQTKLRFSSVQCFKQGPNSTKQNSPRRHETCQNPRLFIGLAWMAALATTFPIHIPKYTMQYGLNLISLQSSPISRLCSPWDARQQHHKARAQAANSAMHWRLGQLRHSLSAVPNSSKQLLKILIINLINRYYNTAPVCP